MIPIWISFLFIGFIVVPITWVIAVRFGHESGHECERYKQDILGRK